MSSGIRPGIRLGYKDDGEERTYRGNAHLLTIAPTRAGKGTDLLIPALLTCDYSALVVDPKGQLAAVTARQRQQRLGQKIVVLNPFNIWPDYLRHLQHVTFNPLASRVGSDNLSIDCQSIAEAIVIQDGVGDQGRFWTDSARQLITGLMMFLLKSDFAPKERSLVKLYDMICGPDVYNLARLAVEMNDPLITGRLSRYAAKDAEEKKSNGEIISTAITELDFMGSEKIRFSLGSSSSELRFSELRRQPMTVYLILPTEYLGPCSKWFRLVVEAALFDLLHDFEKSGPGRPVLMLMDEFAQLKRLQIIEEALAGAAGYGVMLWPVLQDLNQLRELYRDRWETFIGNAGISTWYAPRDNTTAEYLSKLCGETEIGYERKSVGMQPFGPNPEASLGINTGWERIQRPLLRPEEVRGFGDNGLRQDEMLVFATGMTKVIRGKRVSYLHDPALQGLYDPDPYHPK